MIKLIWAQDINNGIAKNKKIPWHIKEDMIFFKNITTNNIVVMGKNTWNSLPFKPLKNRVNYVLSKNLIKNIDFGDVKFIKDFNEILTINDFFPSKDIYIIGGKQIYKIFFPYANELIISKIKQDYNCDLFLDFNLNNYKPQKIINYSSFSVFIYNKDINNDG